MIRKGIISDFLRDEPSSCLCLSDSHRIPDAAPRDAGRGRQDADAPRLRAESSRRAAAALSASGRQRIERKGRAGRHRPADSRGAAASCDDVGRARLLIHTLPRMPPLPPLPALIWMVKIPIVNITKAVITAAGAHQRSLPLQTLIDTRGVARSALAILAGEILDAGVSEIAVIVCPGDEAAYADAAGELARQMQFIPQHEPLGYGHAVHCAAAFTGRDPFLLTVGDHLYTSRGEASCVAQLLATARAAKCPVSAVQSTHESKLPFYGCVGGRRVQGAERLYTEAEQKLVVPGLRAGHYLCFFGMHVLTADVMDKLGSQLADEGRADLSRALAGTAGHERYLAHELLGRRHDIDLHYGLLATQLALGLAGNDRDEVLTLITEALVQSHA